MGIDVKLVIGGELVAGARQSAVVNPASGAIIAQAPRASAEQIGDAVAAAHAAFPAWSATAIEDRAKVLLAMADRIDENIDVLSRILTEEGGCPSDYTPYEIGSLSASLRYFAGQVSALEPKVLEDSDSRLVRLLRRPLGVVAAITPWNFPIDVLACKLPPALLAGNTMVVKPAGTTPLTTLKLAEICLDILPAGVLNVVADDNDLGDVLTSHPHVRKLTFTGSTATGSRVMASGAPSLKRVTLELGGNDAALVLDDADPAAIADDIFMGAFYHSGQSCVGIKRVYAHEAVYDALCDELSRRCNDAVVGDGLEQGITHGPLQNQAQFERAKTFLDDGKRNGRVVAGGTVREGSGYFMDLTVIADIEDGTMLVDEEQFCPVLPIIKVTSEAEAIERANASRYGLGGSVWTSDDERGVRVAERMDTGMVSINKYGDLAAHIPFVGAKQSGLGIEYGVEGLLEFTQLQVVNERAISLR